MNSKSAYFSSPAYNALYATVLLNKLGDSVFSFFVAGYLYSIGIPLAGVLLFFGFEFGLRGLLSPLGAMSVSRFGVGNTLLVAGGFSAGFFVALSAASNDPIAAFACFILYSLSRAVYHPCKHALNATLVDNAHRGRQHTLELVVTSVGGAIGAVLAGTVIERSSFQVAALLAAGFSLTSALPFFWLLRDRKDAATAHPSFLEPYRFLASAEFRPNLLPFFAESATIIVRVVAAPLFLYLTIKHFDTVGLVVGLALTVETLITLWHGRHIDHAGNQSAITRASWLLSVAHVAYAVIARGSVTAFFCQLMLQTSNNMFASAWNTAIHRKISASSKPLVYAAAKELWLCLSELVQLSAFAALAWAAGETALYVMFIAGAVGAQVIRLATRVAAEDHCTTDRTIARSWL